MKTAATKLFCLLLLTCTACTHISPKGKAALDKTVQCSTAKQDLKVLREERATVTDRIGSGVRSVFPIAAVVNILRGQYRDGIEVATGQYNADIDAKIAQIEKSCRVK